MFALCLRARLMPWFHVQFIACNFCFKIMLDSLQLLHAVNCTWNHNISRSHNSCKKSRKSTVLQDEKNEIITTNVWLLQVRVGLRIVHITDLISSHLIWTELHWSGHWWRRTMQSCPINFSSD